MFHFFIPNKERAMTAHGNGFLEHVILEEPNLSLNRKLFAPGTDLLPQAQEDNLVWISLTHSVFAYCLRNEGARILPHPIKDCHSE